MADHIRDTTPLEEPLAELERRLIHDFIVDSGYRPEALRNRGDEEARKVLAAASTYAATKLAEVESRAHYVRDLHRGD